MGEKDDERWRVFSQDGAESEIDLGETGCPAVASQRMSQSHIWKVTSQRLESGSVAGGTDAHIGVSAPCWVSTFDQKCACRRV